MSNEDISERLASGQVWRDFCENLKQAGEQILTNTPDDDFDRAEGYRHLARLVHHFLRTGLDESDPAKAVISTGSVKIGLDNPDYVYAGAKLSPDYTYRLSGQLNDVSMLGIGLFSGALGTPNGLVRDAYVTTSEIEVAGGSFELLISRTRQAGNWLPMGEGTNALNIRQTILRRREEKAATLELTRVDAGELPSPLAPAELVQTLDRVGAVVPAIVSQFQGWRSSFQEHPFEIREIDPKFLAIAQGDPNTTYHYSYWDLGEDEVYVVELTPPNQFDYWNLQIGNHWLESFDFMHYDTHLNHETAVVDADGKVRIHVSAADPGRANWLNTAGHRRGTLALRWVGADAAPAAPVTRVEKRVD